MRQFVTSWAGLLWHKLEIGLMRVGEPFRSEAGDFLGVGLLFFTAAAARKFNHYLFNRVRYTLYIHTSNDLDYPTL